MAKRYAQYGATPSVLGKSVDEAYALASSALSAARNTSGFSAVTQMRALRAVTAGYLLTQSATVPLDGTTNQAVQFTGHSEANDGGGGVFVKTPTGGLVVDNGIVFATSDPSFKWVRQYTGAVQPEWFGARRDGTSAATTRTAIQACVTALPSGGVIRFSRGTYNLRDQAAIVVNRHNITLEAERGVEIHVEGNGVTGFVTATDVDNLTITGFTVRDFTANAYDYAPGYRHAIAPHSTNVFGCFTRVNGLTIDGCTWYPETEHYGHAADFNACTDVRITGCTAYDSMFLTYLGWDNPAHTRCDRVLIEKCHFENTHLYSPCSVGVYVWEADNVVVKDNFFKNITTYNDGTPGHYTAWTTNGNAVYASDGHCNNLMVKDNTILIDDASNGDDLFIYSGRAEKVLIQGNNCRSNRWLKCCVSVSDDAGIGLVVDAVVTGNYIETPQGNPGLTAGSQCIFTGGYAVNRTASYIISKNIFRGASLSVWSDSLGSIKIEGNYIYSPFFSGVRVCPYNAITSLYVPQEISVIGNTVTGGYRDGILVAGTTALCNLRNKVQISDNTVLDCNQGNSSDWDESSGIVVQACLGPQITDNHMANTAAGGGHMHYGLSLGKQWEQLGSCRGARISGNSFSGMTVQNIQHHGNDRDRTFYMLPALSVGQEIPALEPTVGKYRSQVCVGRWDTLSAPALTEAVTLTLDNVLELQVGDYLQVELTHATYAGVLHGTAITSITSNVVGIADRIPTDYTVADDAPVAVWRMRPQGYIESLVKNAVPYGATAAGFVTAIGSPGGVTASNVKAIYLCDTNTPLVDSLSTGPNLVQHDAPLTQVATTLPGSKKCVELVNNPASPYDWFAAGINTWAQASGNLVCHVIVCRTFSDCVAGRWGLCKFHSTGPGTERGYAFMPYNTNPGDPRIWCGLTFFTENGQFGMSTYEVQQDFNWHVFSIVIDDVNKKGRLHSDVGSVEFPYTGSMSNTGVFMLGGDGGTQYSAHMQIALVATLDKEVTKSMIDEYWTHARPA